MVRVNSAEGALLTVGDVIEIPVTEIEDGELVGEGTMTEDGENVVDVIEPSTEPTEIEGTVTSVRHSGGSSYITVSEPSGAEHEIEVPVSEGEKIKLGVNVRVKILKSADGNIESIDVAQTDKLPGFGALLTLGVLSLVSILVKRKEEWDIWRMGFVAGCHGTRFFWVLIGDDACVIVPFTSVFKLISIFLKSKHLLKG